jgi:metal-responsive CopG/Arc/MetJ family transcriptional regulator
MAPPKRDTHGVLVRLHAKTIAGLDDLISKEDDETSRQEIIRRILKGYLSEKGYDVREYID